VVLVWVVASAVVAVSAASAVSAVFDAVVVAPLCIGLPE